MAQHLAGIPETLGSIPSIPRYGRTANREVFQIDRNVVIVEFKNLIKSQKGTSWSYKYRAVVLLRFASMVG